MRTVTIRPRRGLLGALATSGLQTLAALALLATFGSPSAAAETTGGSGALRVGLSTRYPPVAFTKDGELAGLEVDLARAAGEHIGKPVHFEVLEFDELIPALRSKKIDVIMSGMSVTEKRKEQIAFTEPYLRVGQMALVRADDFSRFVAPEGLNQSGVRVGFVDGTTSARYVAASLPRATRVPVAGADEGVEALRGGAIDVLIHDAPTVWRVSLDPNERELLALYEPLTEEYLAWGVRKDDENLKGALDGFITQWKDDGRMDSVVNRWIPVRVEIKAK